MKCMTVQDLYQAMNGTVHIETSGFFKVTDPTRFYKEQVDILALNAAIGGSPEVIACARWIIRMAAAYLGSHPASIHDFYAARGRGELGDPRLTVPAINLRGLTYDTARGIIRSLQKRDGCAALFEIARSEIGYTLQRPAEFASLVMAGAMREEYHGPVFIQGDHFQVNARKYREDPAAELQAVKDLITEAIAAGFYNIDVDTSTLVDLSRPTVREQQELNYRLAAELTAHIRATQPAGITVSVGGEIGEVGGQNSTVEELEAFMDGYNAALKELGDGLVGLSKISVQSGTMHGGVVLPDGTVAEVDIDFDTLESLSRVAREKYGLAGAVQHGASTLPDEAFYRFPETGTAEIHLATAFQNILFESLYLPEDLKARMYAWLDAHAQEERKPDMTDEQFYYRARKRAYGPFKEDFWNIDRGTRKSLSDELEDRVDFYMQNLGVDGSQEMVKEKTKIVDVHPPIPEALKGVL